MLKSDPSTEARQKVRLHMVRCRLLMLDSRMTRLALALQTLEKIAETRNISDETLQRTLDKIDKNCEEQDDINDQMSKLLQSYDVDYGRGHFTVRTKDQKFYFRVDCPDDIKPVTATPVKRVM